MGDCDDRPAARRTRTGGSASGPEDPGSAAQLPTDLVDALHGAPAVLELLMQMPKGRVPPHGTHLDLRAVSKACCREVDAAIEGARWVASWEAAPPMTADGVEAAARALGKAPNLTQLRLFEIGGAELEQLLGRLAGAGTAAQPSTIARVQELLVEPPPVEEGEDSPLFGVDGSCALLRSLAHLPSLQVGQGAAVRGRGVTWAVGRWGGELVVLIRRGPR
jgi:hypothetical protein